MPRAAPIITEHKANPGFAWRSKAGVAPFGHILGRTGPRTALVTTNVRHAGKPSLDTLKWSVTMADRKELLVSAVPLTLRIVRGRSQGELRILAEGFALAGWSSIFPGASPNQFPGSI